ncbi:MAG: tRNA 2-thiouridine(34) synthase MnmA [Myxococcales bacterium]|nr:tRNA 2-thiouridine(34) synthase MnmA [Myxococcales bacterium]
MRVVCAMSGGVDSSVTAAILREAGHEVIGLTMRLYDVPEASAGACAPAPSAAASRRGTCCSPAEIDRAKEVCDQLGIPHYTVDERERFAAAVIDDFAREYSAGRTPNPCVRCNEHVKFGPLLARARALGADALATGHYARIEGGALLRGVDPAKDQSYFLFAMGAAILDDVIMPLGTWTKEHVREKARRLDLINAEAPDSQELCFVGARAHAAIVEERARALGLDPAALAPGAIVDREGAAIGEHDGIHTVTIGQRRGLRVPGTAPRYVLRVVPARNEVIVGAAEALARGVIEVDDLRRLAPLPERGTIAASVQIRHRSPPSPATIELDGRRARVRFAEPVRAVAPGQAAVFYAGDQVLAGGWIAAEGEGTR